MTWNFPLKYSTSKKEYQCDGCAGEFLIPQDTLYARMAYRRNDGHVGTMKLCMRCVCAIQNKMRHAKDGFTVEPGSLRLDRLSSHFRKTWDAYFKRIMELNGSPDGDGLSEKLLEELGIGTVTKQEADKVEEERKEQRVKRTLHREKRQMKALEKRTDAMRKTLTAMLENLAKLHLKETMAWTSGKKDAIDQAKTEYGEYVRKILTAIEAWNPDTKKGE